MSIKKKMIIIGASIFGLIIILGCIYYFFLRKKEVIHNVELTLNGDESITLEVGTEYEEYGASLLVDSIDKTSEIKVDKSNLNVDALGEYTIKYYINIDNKEYSIKRIVLVVDTTSPEIKLNGSDKVTLLKGEKYNELGYIAIDNYDGEITDKVEVQSELDINKVGEYSITYNITDTSGNSSSIKRIIIVKEPKKVVMVSNKEEKVAEPEVKKITNEESITKNKFTSNGFYLEGYKVGDNSFKLILSGPQEYTFDLNNIGNNKYSGSIDLSSVSNGTYNLYIDSGEKELLLNKLSFVDKIKRAKVGDKLVTFNYNNDSITVTIENFSYAYDILIDPGHGGSDTGAMKKK